MNELSRQDTTLRKATYLPPQLPLGAQLGSRAWVRRALRLRPGGLVAPPRLLVAYADPAVGHDGGLYRGAGARSCGPGRQGKLLFAWALDPALQEQLDQLARAAAERRHG